MARNFNELAGNKFSLRSKTSNQIKKIDGLTKVLGPLGDILISTWGGIFMALGTLGIGGMLIYFVVNAADIRVAIQNIFPIILIVIGTFLIAINVVLTNPSFGSQLIVSINFVKNKIAKRNIGSDPQKMDIFRFCDDQKKVIEMNIDGKLNYITIFFVRGSISPVAFDSELNQLAKLKKRFLTNLERDTTAITINTIQNAEIKKKELPGNATPAMVAKRNRKYEVGKKLKNNSQLSTIIVISSKNYNSVLVKTESAKVTFNQGLVVGYNQLEGKELKKEVYKIYGKK